MCVCVCECVCLLLSLVVSSCVLFRVFVCPSEYVFACESKGLKVCVCVCVCCVC